MPQYVYDVIEIWAAIFGLPIAVFLFIGWRQNR